MPGGLDLSDSGELWSQVFLGGVFINVWMKVERSALWLGVWYDVEGLRSLRSDFHTCFTEEKMRHRKCIHFLP